MRHSVRSMTVWVLLAGTMLTGVPAHAVTENAASSEVGVVGAAQQTLKGVMEGQPDKILQAGDKVIFNQKIETDGTGNTQLIFLDKSALTIGPNASVVIDKFVFDPATSSGELAVRVGKGAFRFVGGALTKKDKPVTFKTPVATIGIRGGIMQGSVDGATGQTDSAFVFGRDMSVTTEAGTQVTTQPGTAIMASSANEVPSPPRKMSVVRMERPAPGGGADGNAGGDTPPPASGDGASGDGAPPPVAGDDAPPAASGDGGEVAASDAPPPPPPPPGGPVPLVNTTGASQDRIEKQTLTKAVDDGTLALSGDRQATTAPVLPQFRGHYQLYDFGLEDGGYIQGVLDAGVIRSSFLAPDTVDNFQGSLPFPAAGGVFSIANAMVDGMSVSGFGYRTPGGNMSYYYLRDAASGAVTNMRLAGMLGKAITPTALAGQQPKLQFFKFLPDLSYLAGGMSDLGLFNVAQLSPSLVNQISGAPAGTGYTEAASNPYGLMVDWQRGDFLFADLQWESSAAPVVNAGIKVAFGDARTDGSGLSGRVLDVRYGGAMDSVKEGDIYAGGMDIYGGTQVEGIAFNGQVEYENGMTSYTESLQQAAVAVNSPITGATPPILRRTSTAGPELGFASGFIRQQRDGATDVYYAVYNKDPNKVQFVRNATNNSMGAIFSLTAAQPASNLPTDADVFTAKFGSAATLAPTPAQQAYISDSLYAMEQGEMHASYLFSMNGSNAQVTQTNTVPPFSYQELDGVLVSGAFAANNANLQCSSCEFVRWGVWEGTTSYVDPNNTDQVHDDVVMMPYVHGAMTQNLQNIVTTAGASLPATATFAGPVIGQILNGNMLTNTRGSFTSTVDFANRMVNQFNGSLGNVTFTSNPGASIAATGLAKFAFGGLSATNGTETLSMGNVNGALYGNLAQEMAGNIHLRNSMGTVQASGVFLGRR